MSPPLMQTLLQDLSEVPDVASMAKVLALGVNVGKMPAKVQTSLLMQSVHCKLMEAVRLLLDHGADPFAEDAVVFLAAVMYPWSAAYLPALLARGPAPTMSTSAAFFEPCRQGDMPSVTLLLPTDAESVRQHIAIVARDGFQDALQLLVKQPVCTRTQLTVGLGVAVRWGRLQAAELLLKQGAEPYSAACDSLQMVLNADTPAYAAAGARLGMVRLLLQHGALVTSRALSCFKSRRDGGSCE